MNGLLVIRGNMPSILRNEDGLYEGDLVPYFRILFQKATNLNHPYHNLRHILHVLWLCHKACQFYKPDEHQSECLWPRRMRNLLIAAIFHDFNHRGVAGNDHLNIELAIAALREHVLPKDRSHIAEIETIIRATQFPYVVPTEQLSLPEQIIRDADMAQALSVAWLQQVVFGLAKEWGKDPMEVLQMQEPFHHHLHFHTAWARAEFPESAIKGKVAEVLQLISMLKDEPEDILDWRETVPVS